MYEQRDVRSRMESKIRRTFRRPPPLLASSRILQADARRLRVPETIDAIITSPPYMNELDYVRDNRLRLWFIRRELPTLFDIPRGKREDMFRSLLTRTFSRLLPVVAPNAAVVVVVGDTRRGGSRTDAAKVVKEVFAGEAFGTLRLETEFRDRIPDIRRSRRDLAGTKRETVLVFRSSAQVDRNAKAAS
jgi:tRNA G10  N-methylase Trm11